jgi:peptide deformylase
MIVEDGVGSLATGRQEHSRLHRQGKRGATAYINPEITLLSEKTVDSEEGCLSVPGVWGIVPRAKKLHFKALDRHGRRVEFDAKGFQAIVLQHETDHLDGVLFIDKATQVTKGVGKTSV